MDQSTSKRFQPYARPAPRRQQPEPIFNEDTFQNIPQVIIGLVKKSLSWLGIAQEQVFEPAGRTTAIRDSDRHGEASTSGSGTTNKETTPSTALERLYPDLRDFIVSLKSSKDDRGQNRNLKRSEHEMDTTSDVIEPEHSEHHRAKVRRELSESLDKYGDSKTAAIPAASPTLGTEKNANRNRSGAKDRNNSLDSPPLGVAPSSMDVSEEAIDGLDKEDLVWLPRIRRLTETPLERARRMAQAAEQRRREESLVREPPSPYSIIRRVREDIEPVPQPVSKPLDSVLPYNKDYRKHRQSALSRDTFNEHVMNSGDSGSDADESEHATKGTRDRSRTLTNIRQNRPREKQSENLQGSPGKNRRTSRTDALEDQRTSRGGLQIRSQVATKRTVRHIPGRFSALDSDEEEESLRQEEAAREQRRLHRSSIAGVWDTLSNIVNMDSQQTQPQLQGSISNKVPPQIYPTLQYGQRTKLYNPKLDEILKWSSSSHESTPAPDTNPSTKQKIGFTSPVLSEVVSAAPTVIGTLAAVAGAVGVAKLATDWSGIKLPDNTNKWKCQTCDGMNQNELEKCPSCEAAKPGAKVAPSTTPGVPALFTPSFTARSSLPSTPATNSAEKLDKNKGDEPRKQEDVATNTGREKNQESEKSVPSLGWAAAGFKVPDNSNKWKCPTCDVMNENEKIKCVCCETGKPGAKPAEQKSVALPSLFTPSFSAATPSTSGTSTQAIFSFAAPTTSSTGSTTIDNTSKSPKASALFGFNSPTSDKPSENAIDKPVEKPGPALTWAAAGFKVPDNTNKWKCPTCDVMNENKLEKCACCETSRPGGTTKDASAPPVPALFAFKPPISSSTSISTPGFITSTLPTSEAKVPALFGAQEAEKKQQPTFSFVVPATTAADTKAIPISFGNPFSQKSPTGLNATSELKETKPTQPSFTFGSVSTPTSTSTPSSATSLFSSTAATPATSLFGSKTLTSTSASTSASVSAPTSTPLFGTTLATPPSTSIFGGTPLFSGSTTTSTTGASTPSSTTSLFSLSTLTSSASAPASTVPAAPGPQPLFGASSSAPPATVASNSASKFGSVTSLPFTFGSSSPNITLGQTTAPTASTVAPSTPPTSTSTFSFGSSLTSSTPATPGSGTGSGFGLGPSGFGALSSATAAPFSTTSAPTAAPLTGFSFGGASTATSQPTTKPTFSFGSSTPNSTNTSIPAFTFGGGGNNSNTSTSASSTSSGFGSFDSTSTPANNSMMSVKTPSSVGAIGTTGSGGTGFGFGSNAQSTGMSFGAASSNVSFGGGSSAPTSGFGTLAPGSNGFGASLSTQSGGFGSTSTGTPSNPFGQNSSSFGGQTAGFGSPIGSTTSAGVGFGASSAGFNGSGSSGFGGSNSGGSGFISLAGSGGSTPGFGGASSTGFGGGGGGMQQQQQQQQQGTAMFGGFGVGGGNDGKFGFQNISNAPGGSQYPQQTGVQQPAFSFNVGAGPAPGETPPHNRKFAKMRTKKR